MSPGLVFAYSSQTRQSPSQNWTRKATEPSKSSQSVSLWFQIQERQAMHSFVFLKTKSLAPHPCDSAPSEQDTEVKIWSGLLSVSSHFSFEAGSHHVVQTGLASWVLGSQACTILQGWLYGEELSFIVFIIASFVCSSDIRKGHRVQIQITFLYFPQFHSIFLVLGLCNGHKKDDPS